MGKNKIAVGDCFLISLPEGLNAFGHYIFWDQKYGPLCEIFKLITAKKPEVKDLPPETLFPPIFIGFGSYFKTGKWSIIGSSPIIDFNFPKFRSSFGLRPGEYNDWKIYDGKSLTFIGKLPIEYRSLEFLCGWSPQALEKRIITGKNLYDDII